MVQRYTFDLNEMASVRGAAFSCLLALVLAPAVSVLGQLHNVDAEPTDDSHGDQALLVANASVSSSLVSVGFRVLAEGTPFIDVFAFNGAGNMTSNLPLQASETQSMAFDAHCGRTVL